MTALQELLEWLNAPQRARLLRLSYPHEDAPAARLLPNRFSGVESISRGFRYTVELLSDDAGIDLEEMHGKLLCISLVQAGGSLRPFTGYVWEFKLTKTDGGVAFYEAVLVPWFEFLRLRQNNRLFHQQNIYQQTKAILDGYLGLAQWEWEVRADDPTFTMAVQYGETDHNYVSRRLEHAGFSHHYEHTDKGHTWVVGSDTCAASPIDGLSPAVHYHAEGGSLNEDGIAHWQPVRTAVSAQVSVSGFDFKDPKPIHASTPVNRQRGIPPLEVHRYEGHYGFKYASGAEALARRRGADLDARGKHYEGRGNCDRLVAGRWFGLAGHFGYTGEEAHFLVIQVEHEATCNYLQGTRPQEHRSGSPEKSEGAHYKNRFICQPKSVPWQPGEGFDSTATRILAPQTATVVGPQERGSLDVDEYGRVRVQFHWDRDQTRSCRVRVSSQWAGGELGMSSHPRVGSEAVIHFLDGNPDHPLVTGCVPNRHYMPAWKLPQQEALTGLRSRELNGTRGNGAGGRSNHLVLDDTAGQIQVQLKSDHQASQLSLGHITRIEDNAGRKDARGQGFELRSDGHGAVRAERGLLISTEGRPDAQAHITDMAETVERLIRGQELHGHLADAAKRALAHEAGDQDEVAQALKAQAKEIKGSGGSPEQNKFPEYQAPHLTLASPAGIQTSTQGSTHMESIEHNALTSGGHTSVSANKSFLVSVKEAVRMFAYKAGMRLIAASGDIDLTALKDSINLLAKLNITHAANKISINAKEELELIGGGSYTRYNASGIEHGTNGAWRQQAASHKIAGPANAPGPKLPALDVALKETPPEHQVAFAMQAVPGLSSALLANQPFTLLKNGSEVKKGLFDEHGRLSIDKVDKGEHYQVRLANGIVQELPIAPERLQSDPEHAEFHEHQLSNKGLRADGLTAEQRLAQSERGADAE